MTLIIVIITVLFSVAAFRFRDLLYRFDLSPYHIVHKKQYYRIFTHAFLHTDYMHLGINMLVLYSFGTGIEHIFKQNLEAHGLIFSGTFFYILLYVSSIALSALSTVTRHRNDEGYSAVGASGAVSAVVFTYIFFAPLQKIYFYFVLPIPGIIFGILYLVYSSYMSRRNKDNINHEAHFWGAVVGFLFPILLEPELFMLFIENLFPG
ncbi:MAG: rhomboid family intramembrane serine protease [Bacteroidales bacterium]|nr:rhomboid family intramembrane serine protease [Bacteroidales bacterium]